MYPLIPIDHGGKSMREPARVFADGLKSGPAMPAVRGGYGGGQASNPIWHTRARRQCPLAVKLLWRSVKNANDFGPLTRQSECITAIPSGRGKMSGTSVGAQKTGSARLAGKLLQGGCAKRASLASASRCILPLRRFRSDRRQSGLKTFLIPKR